MEKVQKKSRTRMAEREEKGMEVVETSTCLLGGPEGLQRQVPHLPPHFRQRGCRRCCGGERYHGRHQRRHGWLSCSQKAIPTPSRSTASCEPAAKGVLASLGGVGFWAIKSGKVGEGRRCRESKTKDEWMTEGKADSFIYGKGKTSKCQNSEMQYLTCFWVCIQFYAKNYFEEI